MALAAVARAFVAHYAAVGVLGRRQRTRRGFCAGAARTTFGRLGATYTTCVDLRVVVIAVGARGAIVAEAIQIAIDALRSLQRGRTTICGSAPRDAPTQQRDEGRAYAADSHVAVILQE